MTKDFVSLCTTSWTDQGSAAAQQIRTIVVIAGGSGTHVTRAQNFGVVAVVQLKAAIKDIERAFPQPGVLEFLGVTNDSAVNLVHLFKATVLHDER